MGNQFIKGLSKSEGTPKNEAFIGLDFEAILSAYQISHGLKHSPSGYIVPTESYLTFVRRNGLWGLADELLHTVTPEQGSKIINIRFSQSRYDVREMNALRQTYFQMKKPMDMGALLVRHTTGEPILDQPPKYIYGIDNFDDFSDGVVNLWASSWDAEVLQALKGNAKATQWLQQKDYGILIWVFERGDQEKDETFNWLEDLPHLESMRPKVHAQHKVKSRGGGILNWKPFKK